MVGTRSVLIDGGCTAIRLRCVRDAEEVVTSTVPHQALYRRWRAQTFSEIVGQEAVVETLRNAVRADRVAHAILFVGPRGTGKTSLARILAKAVNCTNLQDGDACDACPSCVAIREGTTLDLIEIDAASNRGIDAVRDLRERLPLPAVGQLRRKVYILDEAHQITRDAWNALLKSLEEPPDVRHLHVRLDRAVGLPAGDPVAPPALRRPAPDGPGDRRQARHASSRPTVGRPSPSAIQLIARLAAGGMRDAESMLDQLLSAGDRPDRRGARPRPARARRRRGRRRRSSTRWSAGDVAAGIAILDDLEERGRDSRALLDQAVDAIRARASSRVSVTVSRPPDRSLRCRPPRAGSRRSTPTAPASAVCASSSSSRCSVSANGASPPARRGTGRAPDARGVRAHPPRRRRPRHRSRSRRRRPSRHHRRPRTTPPRRRASRAAEPAARRKRPPSPNPQPDVRARRPKPRPEVAPPPPRRKIAPSSALERAPRGLAGDRGALSQHPPTKPLIVACRPVAVDGNVVTLGFPEEQAFLKDDAERKKPIIEAGDRRASSGARSAVRCVVANVELAAPDAAGDDVTSWPRRAGSSRDDLVDVGEVD